MQKPVISSERWKRPAGPHLSKKGTRTDVEEGQQNENDIILKGGSCHQKKAKGRGDFRGREKKGCGELALAVSPKQGKHLGSGKKRGESPQ